MHLTALTKSILLTRRGGPSFATGSKCPCWRHRSMKFSKTSLATSLEKSCSILMIWNIYEILCWSPEMQIIKMIPGSWTFHSGMNIMPRFSWTHRHISPFHVRVPDQIFNHYCFHFYIFFLSSQCWSRLEICRDRRDRRSCKIFVSCVNFSGKQRSFLHILQVYTHLNVNFLHNC